MSKNPSTSQAYLPAMRLKAEIPGASQVRYFRYSGDEYIVAINCGHIGVDREYFRCGFQG